MMHLMWPHASSEDMEHMCSVFDLCRRLWASRRAVFFSEKGTSPGKNALGIAKVSPFLPMFLPGCFCLKPSSV